MNTIKNLWNDEAGFVVSTELVIVATILVLGLIVGQSTLRDAVVVELSDLATAISNIDQSYDYDQVTGHSASTAGSDFVDALDFCDAAAAEGSQGLAGSGQCVLIGDGAVGNDGNANVEGAAE